ncbi:poly ADP-ribose polymerase 3 [Actinidia rufa]|uniref:Poly [ADP-ribose] polymerase n=1 Tax=Actinidia rufa TaxID=165716 RepID=A0A7J0H3V8_9ERIC|nr:poly ADP-ribose polymerase 3 [Actinidia rufa]
MQAAARLYNIDVEKNEQVHETRSHAHSTEEKMATQKQTPPSPTKTSSRLRRQSRKTRPMEESQLATSLWSSISSVKPQSSTYQSSKCVRFWKSTTWMLLGPMMLSSLNDDKESPRTLKEGCRTHRQAIYMNGDFNTGNQRLKDMEGKFQILLVNPAERERGGSTKIANALQVFDAKVDNIKDLGRGIPIVSEDWLIDSIEKMEAQPLEVKVYGKRGVHKDTKLRERGGQIFEKDGILYNCAFSLCDLGQRVNDFCVMQLIMVPNAGLHLYFKKGRRVRKTQAEERLEEREDVDAATKKFAKLFEELTRNEFEPWEREKKFQKKGQKFYPIDMEDGVDVRHGGLGFQQKAAAVIHCKLDPIVANFMKILCSQEIYRYALTELALDAPDIPMAMLSEVHLKICEAVLLQFIAALKTMETRLKARAVWDDFSMKWFTLLHSTTPFFFHDYQDLADHAAAGFETIRDITVVSHLIGDMSGSTINDPIFDRCKKLGCSISPVEKRSDDYKMIMDYLEGTYEPVKIGDISYGVSVENIVEVESSACPSYDEIHKLPNKVLLWCGTRSSNLLRHLQKGFIPSISWLPVPGYMLITNYVDYELPVPCLNLAITSENNQVPPVIGSSGAKHLANIQYPDMSDVIGINHGTQSKGVMTRATDSEK